MGCWQVKFIPKTDLQTIDALWRAASNNRFGYSVQKEIFGQCSKQWTRFFQQIGWVQGPRNNYKCAPPVSSSLLGGKKIISSIVSFSLFSSPLESRPLFPSLPLSHFPLFRFPPVCFLFLSLFLSHFCFSSLPSVAFSLSFSSPLSSSFSLVVPADSPFCLILSFLLSLILVLSVFHLRVSRFESGYRGASCGT